MEFTAPLLWYSRGPSLTMNRATGVEAGGSTFASVVGPDGKSNSAMAFSPATGLTDTVAAMTADFTVMFGLSNVSSDITVVDLGDNNGQINIIISSGVYYLRFVSDGETHTQALSWDGTGWVSLKVTRTGDLLTMSENGSLLNTFSLLTSESYGGSVQVMNGQTGRLFDFRIYASAVSENAFDYYYDDIIQHSGDSTCPVW